MTGQTFVDVTSSPTVSLGSISLLSFLTETSTLPIREDPLRLRYEIEPELPERDLQDIYQIEPASDNQLKISRRNSSALISQSLPLDFFTLAGAAAVYAPHSRLPRLVTVYRESAEEPRGISRISASSPLSKCVSKFWGHLNPDASLVREFTIQMPTEQARELFDFALLEQAIETGALDTSSKSVQRLAQRFPKLAKEDAIADFDALRDYLDQWTNALDIDLWAFRDRIRFRWNTSQNENVAIQLSALAEPFLTTFLHKLVSLNRILEANDTDISWYFPGEHHPSDMVADYRGERRSIRGPKSGASPGTLSFFETVNKSDGTLEKLEYVDTVPMTPDVLPFVTQGLALSDTGSATCTMDYDEGPYIQQILEGLATWDAFDALSKIVVDYETSVKIGLGSEAWRKNRNRRQNVIEDAYIRSYTTPLNDELSTRVRIEEPKQGELLGLVEQYFGPVENLINRPQIGQKTLDETDKKSTSPEYKSSLQKDTEVRLVIDDEIKTAASHLWYDLFHPSSQLQVPVHEE